MTKKPNPVEEACEAVEVLERLGRAYINMDGYIPGEALGYGLALADVSGIASCFGVVAEEHNKHLLAAIIRAVGLGPYGQSPTSSKDGHPLTEEEMPNGHWKREGRIVTVFLGKEWE